MDKHSPYTNNTVIFFLDWSRLSLLKLFYSLLFRNRMLIFCLVMNGITLHLFMNKSFGRLSKCCSFIKSVSLLIHFCF